MNVETKILNCNNRRRWGWYRGLEAQLCVEDYGFDSTMLSASKCFTDDHGLVHFKITAAQDLMPFHETNYFFGYGASEF